MRVVTGFLLSFLVLPPALPPEADARQLLDGGHFKQARAMLEPRLKANPSDAAAAAMLARIFVAYGDFDHAVGLAENAVKVDPKVADYHWQLARALGEQAKRAGMLKALGLGKRFREEAEAALALDAKLIEPRLYLISFYAGAPGLAGGDKKKADALADEVAKIDRASGFLAQARIVEEAQSSPTDTGASSQREGLYKQAIDAATTPSVKFDARLALVNLYAAQQKWDAAEPPARELLTMDSHRVEPYTSLAIVYAARARWTDLDALLPQAEKNLPDNFAPYYQAGRVTLTQSTDYARAERYFRKFLTQEPEAGVITLAHGHWRLGLTLEKQNKRADAIAELEQATRLKPDLDLAQKDLKRVRGS